MLLRVKPSRYLVASEPLIARQSGFNGHLVYSTRNSKLLALDKPVWDALRSDRIESLPEKTLATLQDAQFLVPLEEDELLTVLAENRRAIDENNVLYQVIQPSAWCQLDCSYCGQKHSRTRLSEPRQHQFLSRLHTRLERGTYRHVQIGWFGGEPLTGLDVIRKLTPEIRRVAACHSCTYSAKIVTNGLSLTPRVAAELTIHGISEAEVTLDGVGDQHDQFRYTKQGKATFERIFRNLCRATRSTELRIAVRCNVSRFNAETVSVLIKRIASEGLAPLVAFYTSPVYAWGNDADKTALSKEEYAELEMEWLTLQIRLGFRTGLLPPRRPIVCMSVQRDAEVVDAYGRRYNCTEIPYVPAYEQDPDWQLEERPEPRKVIPIALAGRARQLSNFNQQIASGAQQACAHCPMLPVCGGHCPKAWYEGHIPCPSTKYNMSQRLAVLFALNQPQH